MSFSYGDNVKVTLFGQSHSDFIGAVIDGLDAGIYIDINKIRNFMQRRKPSNDIYSTPRRESDEPLILSGLINDTTCGSPISCIIKNENAESADYETLRYTPRPSHADYPAYVKYSGYEDYRGGGHFSARLTAALCFAGAVLMQALAQKNIYIASHISSIGNVCDNKFGIDISKQTVTSLSQKKFPVLNEEKGRLMLDEIKKAQNSHDSIGGSIECCIIGLKPGLGSPVFDGLENRIAQAVFAVPAVKGIEFGAGFASSRMFASEYNDEYHYENGIVKTLSNNSGGILGGLSTGMPIIFNTAVKPVPSIDRAQKSINLKQNTNTQITLKGRFDCCIVPRAAACIEAAAALAVANAVFKGM